jgi:hypothetical protein
VGARERLPVGRRHMLLSGEGRAPRSTEVVVRERLPVAPENARCCERARIGVGGGERRTRIVATSFVAI